MTSARILVVDDEPQIRRVMRTLLTSHGYIVTDARSGDEALERLRDDKPDLILLDMNMPGMSGLEACRAIRSGSEAAIIMLTVRNTEPDKVDALDAGADDYITKPFHTRELLARIRAALRRLPLAPDSPAAIVKMGAIEIDLASRRLTVDGNPVRLTP
ncbi:MAG: response regulator transcription factor, partial [Bryobacteraceae bacterium]